MKVLMFFMLLLPATIYAQCEGADHCNLEHEHEIEIDLEYEISVFGDLIGTLDNNSNSGRDADFNAREVGTEISGNINETFGALVLAALHRHDGKYEFNLEQAYAKINSFPELSIDLGKERLNVGKLNLICPHEWNFVNRPKVLESFFGEEAITGEGVSFSYKLPLPFYLSFTGGIYNAVTEIHEEGGEENSLSHSHNEEIYFAFADELISGRINFQFGLGQLSQFEIGFNGMKGNGIERDLKDDLFLLGSDLTFIEKFDESKILLQAEVYTLNRKLEDSDFDRIGYYLFGNYSINETWEAGLRYDNVETLHLEKDNLYSLSSIITYNFDHAAKIRLQHEYDIEKQDHSAFLQVTFRFGDGKH